MTLRTRPFHARLVRVPMMIYRSYGISRRARIDRWTSLTVAVRLAWLVVKGVRLE